MKRLMLCLMWVVLLFGAIGATSPAYAEVNISIAPFVISPPGVVVPPPVAIEPGWELYPYVYGGPYGYWEGGYFNGHYWRRGHYGHPEWRGPGRSYGEVHYKGHPGHDREREGRR